MDAIKVVANPMAALQAKEGPNKEQNIKQNAEYDFKRAEFSDSEEEATSQSRLPSKAGHKRLATHHHVAIHGDSVDEKKEDDLYLDFDMRGKIPETLNEWTEMRYKATGADDDEDASSDDGVGAEGYELTKHRKGRLKRWFRIGKAHDAAQLLSFKKSIIKKSLLKCNRPHDEQMVQMFKNIMSFMGDRESSKPPVAHARKIVRVALNSTIGVRDEIYLQICKQTRQHPDPSRCLEGWNLLLVCLYSFPPSKNIKVGDYINEVLREEKTAPGVKKRAELARKLLAICVSKGARKEPPTDFEVEAIRLMRLIELQIRLPCDSSNSNNKSFKIYVDPYVSVAEAETLCHKSIGLTCRKPFGLFEANDLQDNLLSEEVRLMDVISGWEGSIRDHELIDSKTKKGHSRQTTVTSLKERRKHNQSKLEDDFNYTPEWRYLLYQAKMQLGIGDKEHRVPELFSDPKGVKIIFNQAKRDVMQSRIARVEKDIVKIAALKLQAEEGDYMADIHKPGFLEENIDNYIPRKIIPRNASLEARYTVVKMYEQKIMAHYAKLKGFTPENARISFLDYVERWTEYGAHWFNVDQKRQLRAYPQFLEMGVTPRGVLLRNPKGGDVLENWPYKEVVSWGFTERKFILVVGDIVQQKRVVFGTKRGKQIRNLIHAHMQYIVKARLDMAKDIHRIAQENLKMSLGYQAHEVAPQNRDF